MNQVVAVVKVMVNTVLYAFFPAKHATSRAANNTDASDISGNFNGAFDFIDIHKISTDTLKIFAAAWLHINGHGMRTAC
ncbi:MAG: hypothetical protein JF609_01490 [Verrucomicrobia bacterium]|nr:hypothetical protein [Verrucomicrobiota bacterium]